jgi:hypothetical protein
MENCNIGLRPPKNTQTIKDSTYFRIVGKSLKTAMSRHAALVAGLPPREKRRVLKQSLQYHDHDVALAILFLLIDPKYAPDLSANSFSDWNSIPTNLEFDHKGEFQKVIREPMEI